MSTTGTALAAVLAVGLAAGSALAAGEMGKDKGMQSQSGQSTPMQSQSGSGMLSENPQQVRAAQEKLQERGYYQDGQIDGDWGPKTAEAVKSFQQSEGLQPTGELNVETAEALGIKGTMPTQESEAPAAQPGAGGGSSGMGSGSGSSGMGSGSSSPMGTGGGSQ